MDEKIPIVPPALSIAPVKVYPPDRRDRLLLPLAWVLGVLFVQLLFYSWIWEWGLLVPVVVAAWYGVLLWYKGTEGFATRPGLLLFGAVCLLALSYAIFANPYFRLWNGMILPVLVAIHLFEWAGGGRQWASPLMVSERLGRLFSGFFKRLETPFQAAASIEKLSHSKGFYVLLGLCICLPLLMVVVPLLGRADALFQHLTGDVVDWVASRTSSWVGRMAAGLLLGPLFFSLLHVLRYGQERKETKAAPAWRVDAALPITVLLAMDGLYLAFVAVQFTALFGGEVYLSQTGVTYAEYARSGFFQLVAVAALNLTLGLLCVQMTAREGRGWKMVQVLSTLLVGASIVMLGSAGYRMTLYVLEYGLSFKRALTYWAMVMLAIIFAAALLKIWRAEFGFFKVLLIAGLAGWLILNYCNVDDLVARYNAGRYGEDESAFYQKELHQQANHWTSWSVAAQIAAMRQSG